MKLTQKLLGFLNRVFDKDPYPFVAFRIDYVDTLAWAISEGTLTLTLGGVPDPLVVDLASYTLSSLTTFLAGVEGVTLSELDADRAGLSALVLLDGAGSLDDVNGGQLQGYTSLLWALLEALGSELVIAKRAVEATPLQIDITTAEGRWLDEIGGYYAVPRRQDETDDAYGPRIVAEVFQARSNNVAIEQAIARQTGQVATVTDAILYTAAFNFFDGTHNFDGTQVYGEHPVPHYGLFDVSYAYDLINLDNPVAFRAQIVAIVERFRAAGTHLRAINLTGSQLADTLVAAPTDAFASTARLGYADTATAPTDAFSTVSGRVSLVDSFTAPNDLTDQLTLQQVNRATDGSVINTSTIVEDISGAHISSASPPVPVQMVSETNRPIVDEAGDFILKE